MKNQMVKRRKRLNCMTPDLSLLYDHKFIITKSIEATSMSNSLPRYEMQVQISSEKVFFSNSHCLLLDIQYLITRIET